MAELIPLKVYPFSYISKCLDPNEDQFEKRKKAKKERTAKNELQRLRNIARSQKGKGSFIQHKIRAELLNISLKF